MVPTDIINTIIGMGVWLELDWWKRDRGWSRDVVITHLSPIDPYIYIYMGQQIDVFMKKSRFRYGRQEGESS